MIHHSAETVVAGSAFVDGQKLTFGFTSKNVRLDFSTGTGPVFFSFDGSNVHGRIGGTGFPDNITFNDFMTNEVWLRSATGSEVVLVTAWAN